MEIFRVDIPNPIESITVGKQKHYLTANLFYSGLNFHVQKQIVSDTKMFLHNYLFQCPKIEQFPIDITLLYTHNKKTIFDLDNKTYFWNKMICDKLVHDGKLPDDSVKYIQGLYYEYHFGEPCLTIIITLRS